MVTYISLFILSWHAFRLAHFKYLISIWLNEVLVFQVGDFGGITIHATNEVKTPSETDDGNNFKSLADEDDDNHELKGPSWCDGFNKKCCNWKWFSGDSRRWFPRNVIKFEDFIPNFQVVDLWDWTMVSSVKKDRKWQVARLIGRLVRQSIEFHPFMPFGGDFLKTTPICEMQVKLVSFCFISTWNACLKYK